MSFDERAKTWDASERRQALAQAVSDAIRERFPLNRKMHLLDIGAGTGLLTRRLLPYVEKICAVDTSEGMLAQLEKNLKASTGSLELHHTDILSFENNSPFDGIVSSMTLHHIEDTAALFDRLFALLKPGGFIAIADLAPEDGSFHDHGNAGVHHFGFEEEALKAIAIQSGFRDVDYRLVHRVEKSEDRHYDIFLLTAVKPAEPLRT